VEAESIEALVDRIAARSHGAAQTNEKRTESGRRRIRQLDMRVSALPDHILPGFLVNVIERYAVGQQSDIECARLVWPHRELKRAGIDRDIGVPLIARR
jgi:hypothetical protein